MASAQKKVVLRQYTGELAWGYLPMAGFVHGQRVDLLDPAGKVNSFLLNEIRWIAYVRDFNLDDRLEPERLGRRSFPGRPRQSGLWLRVVFQGDEILEGIADFDMPALNGMLEDRGMMLTPPDGRSNTLRLFIPCSALKGFEVLGWISTGPKLAKTSGKRQASEEQPRLFG